MAANHFIVPQIPLERVTVVRLGAGNTAPDRMTDVDVGKIANLVAESRYNLTAVGAPIEGFITSVENATSNGFSVGGVVCDGNIFVMADGLQATPGTGAIVVGDYVVAGTMTAKGTAVTYPKVCKATTQTAGSTDFRWRVESLGQVGTGAVGTTMVIRRV